ncbi:MAG: NAD-dependent epimerase/dehydratase family protein [Armatimonadetes bacterium]|nr:MAG: NAD-dependent epimerase/dehydratase family protein [Armatimonadota bacterium]
MKMLVTGGAGFIGSHIQDKLVELGHEVAVVDSLRSGKKENLHLQTKFYKVDVRDKEGLKKVFLDFKPEVIFHLAAQNEVPYSMEHPEEDEDMNIRGMVNLMESARAFGVLKVIYSNTGGALYGEVEEKYLPIVEDHPIVNPTSFYGVSKGCAETYLKLYGNLYGIKWVSLRYSNVYGPRQDGNKEAGIVAIFTTKMLKREQPVINGDGRHTRDYIYVGDVVDANVKALEFTRNDYFNIATGTETSNNEVFTALETQLQTGMKREYGPPRPGDPLRNSLSIEKAKKLLGWEPKVSFSEGIKKTVEYYRKCT